MKLYDRVEIKNIYNKKEFEAYGYKVDDYIGKRGFIAALGSDRLYKYHVHLDGDNGQQFDWAARELMLIED